jgi:hypothetical protein
MRSLVWVFARAGTEPRGESQHPKKISLDVLSMSLSHVLRNSLVALAWDHAKALPRQGSGLQCRLLHNRTTRLTRLSASCTIENHHRVTVMVF